MRPLVLTERALSVLGSLEVSIDDLLVDNGDDGQNTANVHYGEHGIYVTAQGCGPDCRLLVIRRWSGGLFDGVPNADRRSVFDRCVRIALRSFDKGIALNPKWMPYRQDNRVSLFAYGVGAYERILAEVNYGQSGDTYVFGLAAGAEVQDLAGLTPNDDVYSNAKVEYGTLLRESAVGGPSTDENIDLDLIDRSSVVKGFSYDDWLLHLSPRQKGIRRAQAYWATPSPRSRGYRQNPCHDNEGRETKT